MDNLQEDMMLQAMEDIGLTEDEAELALEDYAYMVDNE